MRSSFGMDGQLFSTLQPNLAIPGVTTKPSFEHWLSMELSSILRIILRRHPYFITNVIAESGLQEN
jgi:hypothetical protein